MATVFFLDNNNSIHLFEFHKQGAISLQLSKYLDTHNGDPAGIDCIDLSDMAQNLLEENGKELFDSDLDTMLNLAFIDRSLEIRNSQREQSNV